MKTLKKLTTASTVLLLILFLAGGLLISCDDTNPNESGSTKFSISGTITDGVTKSPISGALVTLNQASDLKGSETTIDGGNYSFKALPSGTYTIVVTADGYANIERNVTIASSNLTENFEMNAICMHVNTSAVAATTPTCVVKGNIFHWVCANCDKKFDGNNEQPDLTKELTQVDLPLAEHDWEYDPNATPPTCTEPGQGSRECKVCDLNEEDGPIAPLGHLMEKTDAEPATCTENGNKEYWMCTRPGCVDAAVFFGDEVGGTVLENIVIAAPGHDVTLSHHPEVPKTCTEDGNFEYWECESCGTCFDDALGSNELDNIVIPTTGHGNREKVRTVPATFFEDGYGEWECDDCNDIEIGTEGPAGFRTHGSAIESKTAVNTGGNFNFAAGSSKWGGNVVLVQNPKYQDFANSLDVQASGEIWNTGAYWDLFNVAEPNTLSTGNAANIGRKFVVSAWVYLNDSGARPAHVGWDRSPFILLRHTEWESIRAFVDADHNNPAPTLFENWFQIVTPVHTTAGTNDKFAIIVNPGSAPAGGAYFANIQIWEILP